MSSRILLRRGTSADWLLVNPVLAVGEPGFEVDTGKLKFGDGVTTWTLLSYFSGASTQAVINAVYPLIYNQQTGSLSVDTDEITDGGNF